MLKSQFVSTDIYSDQSDNENEILLRIDSADPTQSRLFQSPEGSDFKLIQGNRTIPVHKHIIFKHMNLHVLELAFEEGQLQIPLKFNRDLLTGVVSCLYGLELKICRSQGLEALEIIHFLQIGKLKKIMEEDIQRNFEQYQLFPLLEKAKEFGLIEIQEMCLNQLQLECYQQMRYCKFHLLNCREDVFKTVVHKHNERRWEDPGFGVSDKFIQQLIQEYCRHNNYSQKEKNQLIREFNELSVKADFSSNFTPLNITPLRFKEAEPINIKVYTPRNNRESMVSHPKSFKSTIQLLPDSSKSMIVDLTFMGQGHKRRKSSRSSQNNESQSKLCCDVIHAKEENSRISIGYQNLRLDLDNMMKTMKIKETEANNNKIKLSQIQNLLQDCQKSLMENNRETRLLEVRINKIHMRQLRQNQVKNEDQEEDDDNSSESEEEQKVETKPTKGKKDEKLSVSLIQSKWVCC